MTCLAVCAAMRPKFLGVTATSTRSPSSYCGRMARASSSVISHRGSLTSSTTVLREKTSTCPFWGSMVARTLDVLPKLFLYAEISADSMAV